MRKTLILPALLLAVGFFSCDNSTKTSETLTEETPSPINKPQIKGWEDAVFYQIFPDRFRNGDTANDPTYEEIKGGWPDRYFPEALNNRIAQSWQPHPWTSDWYKVQPWEENIPWSEIFEWAKPGDAVVDRVAGMRRYGGDLQGVINQLDYLQALGVNVLYFNPLFESPSLHKYDARMYHHIDNNFGPDPKGDAAIWATENPADPATWQWTAADKLFLQLIATCHERGIRVIIDGVFNHTGTEFWAFKDLVEKQEKSAYKDWYDVVSFDNPATKKNEFDYKGWIGNKDLPEFTETESGLTQGPRNHVKAIVQRWMDPNGDGDPSDGVDGWRLDVAEMVSINFWKDFNGWVKETNPNAYITGEIWWDNWQEGKMFNAAPWLQPGVFDAVMNYRFARAVVQFTADQKRQISAHAFVDSLEAIYDDYPWERVLTSMNLVGSHDIDRIASQLQNPDRVMDHQSSPYQNREYDYTKPSALSYQKQRLVAALQVTLPGAPMFYYGDEIGMWGSDDPDCRKPMLWPDLTFDEESHDIFGKKRDKADAVKIDYSLLDWYKKLIALRNQEAALRKGMMEVIGINNLKNMVIFKRKFEQESLVIVVNNSAATVYENLPGYAFSESAKQVTDLLNGTTYNGNEITLELLPYTGAVLKEVK